MEDPCQQQKKHRELSLALEMPSDTDEPTGPMTAHWADGSTWKIPNLSVADYRERSARPSGPAEIQPVWRGARVDNQHILTVKRRTDRFLLMSLYEQQRQILQVRVAQFSLHHDKDPEGPDAEARAGAFMTELGQAWSSGTMVQKYLVALRNQTLKEEGVPSRCNHIQKTTAASVAHGDTLEVAGNSVDTPVVRKRLSQKVSPTKSPSACETAAATTSKKDNMSNKRPASEMESACPRTRSTTEATLSDLKTPRHSSTNT